MDFFFPCPKCNATYEIVRHKEPPAAAPICARCGEELPWGDKIDWFAYRPVHLAFPKPDE
jgi:hypothetical protein